MHARPSLAMLRPLLPHGTIGAELGAGGYKVVYEFSTGLGKEALKVVHVPRDPDDPTVQEANIRRLLREIQILESCKSPFLVKLGSIAPQQHNLNGEDYVIYSEELLSGEALSTRIKRGDKPSVRDLAQMGYCCLSVIWELWQSMTVHRDIKPANIMVTGDPIRPYVMLDLGVAFVVGGTPLTRDPRLIMGTLYYLAPEMLEQDFRDNLDYRADLYATGLTMYEYAHGQNPFARRHDVQYTTLRRIHDETPQQLHSLRSDLPPALCQTIDQMLKKRPALRPNIRLLIHLLEKYL